MVHIGIKEILGFGDTEHLVAFFLVEEFALFVEQLQGIPYAWVMAGRDDDAAAGTFHGDGNLGGGGGGQTDVHHIESHTHEGSAYDVFHHLSADARIASHNDLARFHLGGFADKCGICRCKLDNIQWIQCVTCRSADCTADAGNRFDKCHKYLVLTVYISTKLSKSWLPTKKIPHYLQQKAFFVFV